MSYRVTATDPQVTLDTGKFEQQVALFCKAQGIATDAAYQTAVNGLTTAAPAFLAAVKALLLSVTLVP